MRRCQGRDPPELRLVARVQKMTVSPLPCQKIKKAENVVLASSLSRPIFVSVVRQQPLVDVVIMIKAKEELRVTSSARDEQQAPKAI